MTTPNNTHKYVVYLTMYTGHKLPKWYIGSSYEEKVLSGYNGSVCSKEFKDIYKSEQKENKHLFKTRILSYHENRKDAIEEELRLQKMHNVKENTMYINKSYAQKDGFFGYDNSGKNNPNFGKRRTRESIDKQKSTVLSDAWKNTVGKMQIEKLKKTREKNKDRNKLSYANSHVKREKRLHEEFTEIDGNIVTKSEARTIKRLKKLTEEKKKEITKKRLETILDSEWKATTGKLMIERIKQTKIERGVGVGANNGNAKSVCILNSRDELQYSFSTVSELQKFIKENSMILHICKKYIRYDDEKIFKNIPISHKTKISDENHLQYEGWYATYAV